MCKMCKCPRNFTMNTKSSNFVKNGLNLKLKHRNAQNFILSGRIVALTGRPGDLMKNLETPGKTRRVGRYAVMGGSGNQWVNLNTVMICDGYTCRLHAANESTLNKNS